MGKTIVRHVIVVVGAYGMGFFFGGPLWAFGVSTFALTGILLVTLYDQAHPEKSITERRRRIALAEAERYLSFYRPYAVRWSNSWWQILCQSALFFLLLPMLSFFGLLRYLWSE